MSYLFDGIDDYVRQDSATWVDPALVTVIAMFKAVSFGGQSRGRIFAPHLTSNPAEIGSLLTVDNSNFTNGIAFSRGFDGDDGYWGVGSIVTTGHWMAVAATHDRTSLANDPAIWTRDFDASETALTSQTVSEAIAPTGSPRTPDRYLIGSNDPSTNTRAFNGRIAYVQVFDRILSEAEMNAAVDAPGSVTSGLILYQRLDDDTLDDGPNGFDATASGAVLDADDPPVTPAGGSTLYTISLGGSITPTGELPEWDLYLNALAGTITPTGTLATELIPGAGGGGSLFEKSLGGTLTPVGALFLTKNPSAGGSSGFPMRFLQPRTE